MSKVTSKYQVSIPRDVARQMGIKPGHEIEWSVVGEAARVTPRRKASQTGGLPTAERLALFDASTARSAARAHASPRSQSGARDWKRDDLYERR